MKQELINRALLELGKAQSKGRTAFILPYPYDRSGMEEEPLLTREEYRELIQSEERPGWQITDDSTAHDFIVTLPAQHV